MRVIHRTEQRLHPMSKVPFTDSVFDGETIPREIAPRDWLRYSNQMATDGQSLGHGGYGGQYMLANPDTGVVVAFFSVLENADAIDLTYSAEVIRMAEEVTRVGA